MCLSSVRGLRMTRRSARMLLTFRLIPTTSVGFTLAASGSAKFSSSIKRLLLAGTKLGPGALQVDCLLAILREQVCSRLRAIAGTLFAYLTPRARRKFSQFVCKGG